MAAVQTRTIHRTAEYYKLPCQSRRDLRIQEVIVHYIFAPFCFDEQWTIHCWDSRRAEHPGCRIQETPEGWECNCPDSQRHPDQDCKHMAGFLELLARCETVAELMELLENDCEKYFEQNRALWEGPAELKDVVDESPEAERTPRQFKPAFSSVEW